MLVGQKQESRSKLAGSTERLGYCVRGWSDAVVIVATEMVRLRFTKAGRDSDEVGGISSEMRSTSIITGGALSTGNIGLGLLADAVRDDVKKELILGWRTLLLLVVAPGDDGRLEDMNGYVIEWPSWATSKQVASSSMSSFTIRSLRSPRREPLFSLLSAPR